MHVSLIHIVNCISYCLMLWNAALANDSKDRFFCEKKDTFFFSIFGRNKKKRKEKGLVWNPKSTKEIK